MLSFVVYKTQLLSGAAKVHHIIYASKKDIVEKRKILKSFVSITLDIIGADLGVIIPSTHRFPDSLYIPPALFMFRL